MQRDVGGRSWQLSSHCRARPSKARSLVFQHAHYAFRLLQSRAIQMHFTFQQLVLLMKYSICRKSTQKNVNQSQLLSLNILDILNSIRGFLKQRSTIVDAAISVLLKTTSHQRHLAFDCWPAAEVGDSDRLAHHCHWAAPCRSGEHPMNL
jgi:hypothetical protein